ncbi:glycosyltransferase family 2 protein [Polaribacter aestuariivivens]|uniref:glycosyltransferase family 2 protein n=1 Tax=Polaribacter aestuariivivens TaxID=2304626 RepID=UPI003F492FED
MKFSLIVCTYMRPKALQTLLNSIKEQILYPNEILIIDGSADKETEQILLKNKFKNVSYYRVDEENRGLTRQRNYGISKVREDIAIVCFLDDDTVLDKNYFYRIINTYKLKPDALAVGGYITNEVKWKKLQENNSSNYFFYDGWARTEPLRFKIRKRIGLLDNTKPGWMPEFSNGRSVSFLPPSGKIYEIEQIMGGVSSYRKEIFKDISFSNYFIGYGLYEDADFSIRLAKKGKIYLNTSANLEHYHNNSGRPNKFKYGKMVIRNGWYVWRVKYKNPKFKSKFKWYSIALLLTFLRFINIFNTNKKVASLTESLGRIYGLFTLLFIKPKID